MSNSFSTPSDNTTPQVRVVKIRPVRIVTYPGVEIIDLTGPMEVFAFANYFLQRSGVCSELAYPIEVLAAKPGSVKSSCCLQIIADCWFS